jgi:hypothetical protein
MYSKTLEAEKLRLGIFSTIFSFPKSNWRKGTSMVRETRENKTESKFTTK